MECDLAPRPSPSDAFPDWSLYDYSPLSNLVFARGVERLLKATFWDTIIGSGALLFTAVGAFALGYLYAMRRECDRTARK